MIDIATGASRKETAWKNEQVNWSDIVNKLSTTHHTHETFKAYMSMTKEQQDSIKDIGGFVGGYLIGGVRNKTSVKHRQLITLDIDAGTLSTWDDFTMLYGEAACIYSTHKHSEKTPRYRIVMPLDRPVSPEEYEAIARRIAGSLGMDLFDPTTFQPYRLMYWPSTSKDGVYFFESQKGKALKADKVLASYRDWREWSEWPQCESETKIVDRLLKKQEDPLTKKGLVGAFCRVYTIGEAITEFELPYEETDADNRYSYTHGQGSKGAIVYDDLFMYSNHSSDPVSCQLVNAFDLVRVHKFGDLDDGTAKGGSKSFSKMMELCQEDSAVVAEVGVFKGISDGKWLSELKVQKSGDYEQTINNVAVILRNDEELKGAFAYNQFDGQGYVLKYVPWNQVDKVPRMLEDSDDSGLRLYLETHYNIFHISKTEDAMKVAIIENAIHPVRDYLDSLTWDGVPRLDTLLIDSFGVEDTEYSRMVCRITFTAAVARIYTPGCQFDYMLCLVGDQGQRKSSFIRELGKDWFSDSIGNIHNKEGYESLQGVWMLEWAELATLKKAEVEPVKNFITKPSDRFRVVYAKRPKNFPRQIIFIGTTNTMGFLNDPTGARRFWPVVCKRKYKDKSMNSAQVMAEAKYRFEQGELLYLSDELEIAAGLKQAEHTEVDDREGLITRYLEMLLPAHWEELSVFERANYVAQEYGAHTDKWIGVNERDKVCAAEIWRECFRGEHKDMTTFNTKFIHNIMMKQKGWVKQGQKRFGIYGAQLAYVKVNTLRRKAERVEEIVDELI